MQTTGGLNDMADFTDLEPKRGRLKLLLHVAALEESEIATFARAAAVAFRDGELAEGGAAGADAGLVAEDDGGGLFLGAGDVGFLPARGPAAVLVLDEEVRGAHAVRGRLARAGGAGGDGGLAVVLGHVFLELVGVGALRGLPGGSA